MKVILALFGMILISGCLSGELKVTDVSSEAKYKKWVGVNFKIKQEVLILFDSRYDMKSLRQPDITVYPTIAEYRKTGKTKKSWDSSESIIGIAEVGREFEIISVGFYVFNTMIGKRGLLLVKDKNNGEKYYIHESDLFSFYLDKLSDYLEVIPRPPSSPR